MSFLYILQVNPLSVGSICNYFLPYWGLDFILFIVSFAVQTLESVLVGWTNSLFTQSEGFANGSVDKEPACNAGDTGDEGLIPVSGRSPGGGHSNPLQYSCLENPVNKGDWWATVHRVAKSRTRLKWLSMLVCSGKRKEVCNSIAE